MVRVKKERFEALWEGPYGRNKRIKGEEEH
jgi:hypothetical protein